MLFKVIFSVLILCLLAANPVLAQQRKIVSPGAEPYTPTRIEWLTTTLQASLRTEEPNYSLQITSPDYETILIYVRYFPTVNREEMNIMINSARKVIHITAKSYGWDSWLKIREDVQMQK
jgi:hypothetical protein